ncbi:MAG TPA: cation:proton antiporter [Candidatus Norongarragalinales archaeon]|nr:cation:proton antiporter [Candidatus Norongarragalinales archaeon]
MIKEVRQARKNAVLAALTIMIVLAVLLYFSVIRASLFGDVPEEKRIWFEITFLLLTAVLAELLVGYLRQPVVMVLLLLGVLISPSSVSLIWPLLSGFLNSLLPVFPLQLPHLVSAEGVVKAFAQLGAIILLFKIGLHSEIQSIFNLRNLTVAVLGVLIPFLGGYGYALLTGESFFYAVFLGAALTATSVGVTVAVLQELKVLEKRFAQTILGAAVIDDILALLLLSLVQHVPTGLSAEALSPFLSVLFIAFVFVVGGILVGQWIVRKHFDRIREESISQRTLLSILAFMLFYAYVAEYIGLSAIVGAFIAGVTLNYSKIVGKILEAFFPLEAFFTPLFFISLGMFVDVRTLGQNIFPIAAITLIAIATKMLGCGVGARIFGASKKESLAVGFGMVPRGEIALIIALYGLTAVAPDGSPLLTAAQYSIISAMAFLTTVIVPFGLQKIVAARA